MTEAERRQRRISLDQLLSELARHRPRVTKPAETQSLDSLFASALWERELSRL